MNAPRIANQYHATFKGARGRVVQNHFADVSKMVGKDSGVTREVEDRQSWVKCR